VSIPVIDLTDALGADASRRYIAAKQIRGAAETSGFFYVSNHGVSPDLVRRQFEVAARFFQLPAAVKRAVAVQTDQAKRGYEAIGSQRLDENASADLKESFQFGVEYPADHPYVLKNYPLYGPNLWPADLADFKSACQSYFAAASRLATQLLELLALSLDLPATYFSAFNTNPSDTLRLLWYPPHPTDAGARTFGAGSHTDWGALTILAQDSIGGLEVQMPDGAWVPATPIEGTFVVNLGDMIPRWTNGRYRSNHHRVLNKNGHGRNRQSIVYFADLDVEARIEPIETLKSADSAAVFAPCTVGEHLEEMHRRTYS
jgi:isopenicillin N synthase-like dioxygenase